MGQGFTCARIHGSGCWGVDTCQCNFTFPAPKISPPHAHLWLSPTPTHSSGSDGDSDVDSELEERVDEVKSWLSKNKGSSKALSDDGSLKGSRWVQDWTQGWLADDRVSCARGQPGCGVGTHGMWHSGCCAPRCLHDQPEKGKHWRVARSPLGTHVPTPKGTSLVPLPSIPPALAPRPTLVAHGHPQPPLPLLPLRGSWSWALALSIVPPRQGWIPPPSSPCLQPPPRPLSEHRCLHSPQQRQGTCPGAPTAQGQRRAGLPSPTPVPWRKRSTAEHRLLLSKPNFLARLQPSPGAPPIAEQGGKI